jgi:hypothetical protein
MNIETQWFYFFWFHFYSYENYCADGHCVPCLCNKVEWMCPDYTALHPRIIPFIDAAVRATNQVIPSKVINIVMCLCDYRRSSDWWLDLLTTYNSWLQVISALPSIPTIHKSTKHTLSLFQYAVSSPTVPWQRLLTVEIIHLYALRFCLHSLPCRTAFRTEWLVNWTLSLAYNITTFTTLKTPFFYCYVRAHCRGNLFTEPLPRNRRDADHLKHRSPIAASVYIAGVT